MNETDRDLKVQLEEWSKFLDVFGNLLPGGIGVYECADHVYPIYLSPGVLQLSDGFNNIFYHADREGSEQSLLLDSETEKLEEAMREVLEHHKMLDCTLRYRKSPKKTGWVWIRGRLAEETGQRNIFLALILDVTKQKELESELTVQNERYRLLEETSNEILFELRVREDVLTFSYKEIGGELIRQRIPHYTKTLDKDPMVHPDYLDLFRKHLRTAMKHKTGGQFEYLSMISGHGYEWHRVYYSSLTDETGHISRIIGRIKNVHDEVVIRMKKQEEMEIGLNHPGGIRQKVWDSLENADFDDKHMLGIVAINHYKSIIEQNGVSWGDAALQEIADILQELLSDRAIMGNIQNGEMLLYGKNLPDEEIDKIMEAAGRELQQPEHRVAGITLSATIGVSVMYGIVDYASFIQEAEEALYLARITKGKQYIRV